MSRLQRCHNISDLRRVARRRLPSPIFHYLDGGSDDERSLARNTAAFDDYELMPNYLVDISKIDLSTTVLGRRIEMPFFCSPTGMSRLFHHDAEPAVARAAAKFGTYYSLSTLATTRLERISAVCSGPKMFQIYILKDRELTREFVARCKAARFDALCLTVDSVIAGNRERDKRTGMTMKPRFSLGSLASFAAHPGWWLQLIRNHDFRLANLTHRETVMSDAHTSVIEYVNSQYDRTLNWNDVAWLIEQWGGPFAIKGLQSVQDAQRAVQVGASAIMISNHGGRQLETAPAPVDCVARIRDAVGDRIELIVDGGIRRGTHVIKALALGANACSIGRGYLYGLAAGGQAGVEHALGLLRAEVERGMALLGCSSVPALTREHVSRRN